MNSLFQFAHNAGVTGYPLLVLATLTVAVVFERVFYYILLGRRYSTFSHDSYRKTVSAHLPFQPSTKYVEGLLATNFTSYSYASLETLKHLFQEEWRASNRYIKFLEYTVGIAPLLGILGTITGIIKSFSAMKSFTPEVRSVITGGIAEALLTTAAGLVIAVVALTAIYTLKWFQRKWFEPVEECLTLIEAVIKDEESKNID